MISDAFLPTEKHLWGFSVEGIWWLKMLQLMLLLRNNNKKTKAAAHIRRLHRQSGVLAFLHPALFPWCHPSSSPHLLQPRFVCSTSIWCCELGVQSGFVPLCWVFAVNRGDGLELWVSGAHPLPPSSRRACPPSSPCPGFSGWPMEPSLASQCFSCSYSFLLEMSGPGCQHLKEIVRMERSCWAGKW